MKRILVNFVIFAFSLNLFSSYGDAQITSGLTLSKPGTLVEVSPAFSPLLVKGLRVHPDNPLLFDFIMDPGDDSVIASEAKQSKQEYLRAESERLIKYFLACLTIPEEDLWVNLSPYEKDRMIPQALGQTELGRDMLAQDYILKQLTSSLIYPEQQLGREFWDRVYKKAQAMYGTTEIPVNTFNKVWVLADTAKVYEHKDTAYLISSHLQVMLDEDYLAKEKATNSGLGTVANSAVRPILGQELGAVPKRGQASQGNPNSQAIGNQIIRELILPEIEKEVNTGKNFAPLRQIFHSFILATWYKKNLKQALLSQVYANKAKVGGLNSPLLEGGARAGVVSPEQIYQQYIQAYKKGVFNYVKEEANSLGQAIPRKYFSGGTELSSAMITTTLTANREEQAGLRDLKNRAMLATVEMGLAATNPAMTQSYEALITPFKRFFDEFTTQLSFQRWGQTGYPSGVEYSVGLNGKIYYKNSKDYFSVLINQRELPSTEELKRFLGKHLDELGEDVKKAWSTFDPAQQTVLIVDDESLLLNMLENLLRRFGYNVLKAENGQQALDLVRAQGGRGIDLVITDNNMPNKSGEEMVLELYVDYPQIPVIFTSGRMIESKVTLVGNPNVKAMLEKPYGLSSIMVKVSELAPMSKAMLAEEVTVLLVEDNKELRETLKITFEQRGYRVIEAGDGQEGLARVEEGGVDLVITDNHFPSGISGDAMTDQIKAHLNQGIRGIPVISISGESFSRGYADKLPKPFTMQVLVQAVERLALLPSASVGRSIPNARVLSMSSAFDQNGLNVLHDPRLVYDSATDTYDVVKIKQALEAVITVVQESRDLKVLAANKARIEQGEVIRLRIPVRLFDGSGSSFDLWDFFRLAAENLKEEVGVEGLATLSAVISAYDEMVPERERLYVDVTIEKGKDGKITYVAPQYFRGELITDGNPQLNEKGRIEGGQANAVDLIVGKIFGVKDVKVTLTLSNADVIKGGGLESSNGFNAALFYAMQQLTGAKLSHGDLYGVGLAVANGPLSDLTGLQGWLADVFGNVQIYFVGEVKDANGKIVNPRGVMLRPLFNTKADMQYISDRVYLGQLKQPPDALLNRTATLINELWTYLVKKNDPEGVKIVLEMLKQAHQYADSMRNVNVEGMQASMKRYVELRDQLTKRAINLAFDYRDAEIAGQREAIQVMPVYVKELSDLIFVKSLNPKDAYASQFKAIKDFYERSDKDKRLLRENSIYSWGMDEQMRAKMKEYGVEGFALGAGGPGANWLFVARDPKELENFMLDPLVASRFKNTVKPTIGDVPMLASWGRIDPVQGFVSTETISLVDEGGQTDVGIKEIMGDKAQVASNVISANAAATVHGGIDLKRSDLKMDVEKRDGGIQMVVDAAMIARFQVGDFNGVTPNILQIVPAAGQLNSLDI